MLAKYCPLVLVDDSMQVLFYSMKQWFFLIHYF